ncbi:MAG TPA: Nramp family divalent metal transporter, partial [Nitrospiria bacterium]
GILVAATGVGAGDLATASFAGSRLGTAVLWAVLLGAFFKFVLTEGLARWQLATGQTFLEGLARHAGPAAAWIFLPYLLFWSFFVGSALMSACGVTLHAIFPVFQSASQAKMVFGMASSLAGLALVLIGGFKLFERVMAACIGLMFFTVLLTAVLLLPETGGVIRGMMVPSIPEIGGEGLAWTMALIGGVGGTVTILCYGYWIREKGRTEKSEIGICRIDLGVGYLLTAIFGLSMVIIGSTVDIEGKGAGLLIVLADRLQEPLGEAGRWIFLIGAFGAVFSSLLGVWQAVPYLFADVWRLFMDGTKRPLVDTRAWPYRSYLFGIAVIPMAGLWMSFREIQKFYAVIGAAFLPLLALALLIMNGRRSWVGDQTTRWPGVLILISVVFFFSAMAWRKWAG